MLIKSLGLRYDDFVPKRQQSSRTVTTAIESCSVQKIGSVNRSNVKVSSWTLNQDEKQHVPNLSSKKACETIGGSLQKNKGN